MLRVLPPPPDRFGAEILAGVDRGGRVELDLQELEQIAESLGASLVLLKVDSKDGKRDEEVEVK